MTYFAKLLLKLRADRMRVKGLRAGDGMPVACDIAQHVMRAEEVAFDASHTPGWVLRPGTLPAASSAPALPTTELGKGMHSMHCCCSGVCYPLGFASIALSCLYVYPCAVDRFLQELGLHTGSLDAELLSQLSHTLDGEVCVPWVTCHGCTRKCDESKAMISRLVVRWFCPRPLPHRRHVLTQARLRELKPVPCQHNGGQTLLQRCLGCRVWCPL